MLLRPRKTLYKSSHKKRSFIGSINYNLFNNKFFKKPKYYYDHNKLVYGQYGLKNKNPNMFIYNKNLFRIKLFLKKTVRRSNITNRYLWVKVFPHIPVTKKVIGSRMGKGKGKNSN